MTLSSQAFAPVAARLRRLPMIETIVAVAIALTLAAVWYREPLTHHTISFGADGLGKSFDSYVYDDAWNGGDSHARFDTAHPLDWTCTLRTTAKWQWPYCGYGWVFDRQHVGRGIDLSRFPDATIRLVFHGSARSIRLVLKDHVASYGAPATTPDKPNELVVPLHEGEQSIPLTLSDFAVAEWWKDQTKASPALARPSFGNVAALELVFGNDGEVGPQQFRIESIRFERESVSVENWYAAIGLCWFLLGLSIALFRRRQMAEIRRSAEEALCRSERLYRGILEATTDTVVLLNPAGEVQLVNGPGLKAMELDSPGQVLGKHWTRLWRNQSAAIVATALDQARTGTTSGFRAFCETSKGTSKWWEVVVAPMRDDDGALKALLTISRDVTTEREKSEQLKWASEHDALTHLPNRRAFHARLQGAVVRAMATGEQVGLLMVDLDHFKHVNDSLGHSAGDELLKIVADRLRTAVRDTDFVARLGGDEFAIILEPVVSDETLTRVGADVLSRIRAPFRAGERAIAAGASIGGTVFPTHAATADDLFKNADTALYALKQNGRGGVRLFDGYMLDEAEKTASQLRLARDAIDAQTVVPAYQPKFDLESGAMAGLEALLRWRHVANGLQLPSTVEQAFLDYQLAARIGEQMQRSVADDMRRWLDDGLDFGRVAINAAPAEFLRDDYAEHLLSILESFRIPPAHLEVEITEHAFASRETEYVARALAVLKDAGVTIALDDFGTGSSSLSHLRDFPVDVLKVDMSFVQQMAENDEIAAIVTAVVSLARSLSIQVVAEGVETPAQRDLLRAIRCDLAQGHLFSAALGADAVAAMMTRTRAAA